MASDTKFERYEKLTTDIDEESETLLESLPGDESIQDFVKKRRIPYLSMVLGLLVIVLLVLAFYSGYHLGQENALPHLPTHAISKDAIRYVVKHLNMQVEDPENALYTGGPRPEHEEAWDDLLRGFNIRIPRKDAAQTIFESYALHDGSGDLWGTPFVFHNLHCLKAIRELNFPETYPMVYEMFKPTPDGNISLHLDHCLEGLRQAVMCQGDMTLVGYEWHKRPDARAHGIKRLFGYPHLCVDWERLYGWASVRTIDPWDEALVGPDLVANLAVKLKEVKDNAAEGEDSSPDFSRTNDLLTTTS